MGTTVDGRRGALARLLAYSGGLWWTAGSEILLQIGRLEDY